MGGEEIQNLCGTKEGAFFTFTIGWGCNLLWSLISYNPNMVTTPKYILMVCEIENKNVQKHLQLFRNEIGSRCE